MPLVKPRVQIPILPRDDESMPRPQSPVLRPDTRHHRLSNSDKNLEGALLLASLNPDGSWPGLVFPSRPPSPCSYARPEWGLTVPEEEAQLHGAHFDGAWEYGYPYRFPQRRIWSPASTSLPACCLPIDGHVCGQPSGEKLQPSVCRQSDFPPAEMAQLLGKIGSQEPETSSPAIHPGTSNTDEIRPPCTCTSVVSPVLASLSAVPAHCFPSYPEDNPSESGWIREKRKLALSGHPSDALCSWLRKRKMKPPY